MLKNDNFLLLFCPLVFIFNNISISSVSKSKRKKNIHTLLINILINNILSDYLIVIDWQRQFMTSL